MPLLALLLLGGPCAAKELFVVLLPGTSLADWRRADAPNLHRLLATGAVAVMNTRTARLPNDHTRETPESAALTLGAGSRAAGGPEATDFRPAPSVAPGLRVTAAQLYARRTGSLPPAGGFVNVQWPRVLAENTGRGYDIHPGDLGDALARAGVSIQAVGGPLAFAVATDGRGTVAHNAGVPGVGGHCVVWDAGHSLSADDAKIGALMARSGDVRLVVLSPDAGDAAYSRGERLCPVAVWGPGVPPGQLYSPATRRAGLVTDTDFAVSVASYFGIGAEAFPVLPFGVSGWTVRPGPDAVERAAALETDAATQGRGMRALPYFAVLLGVWMLGVTLLDARRPVPTWAFLVPTAVILALAVSVSPGSLVPWLAVSLLAVLLVKPLAISDLAGLLVVVLVGDMLLGDPLMRRGLLGYSAIEGARYYGIGNEAMGALIGACLVAADAAWGVLRGRWRFAVWAGLAGAAALLGSPGAGAKAGGLVVALAAFGVYAWRRSGQKLDWRVVALGAAAILLTLLGVAALDARLGAGGASHFGRAVARLSAGGTGEWADIAWRKFAVEGHLLTHSAWAVALWAGLASLILLTRRTRRGDTPLRDSGLVAVVACLAVNDAGTVAAALCLTILWGHLGQAQKRPRRRERSAGATSSWNTTAWPGASGHDQ